MRLEPILKRRINPRLPTITRIAKALHNFGGKANRDALLGRGLLRSTYVELFQQCAGQHLFRTLKTFHVRGAEFANFAFDVSQWFGLRHSFLPRDH